MLRRRDFVLAAVAAAAPSRAAIGRIERIAVWKGREGGTTWFHPRACAVPGRGRPRLFLTLQSITGSDVYGPVHWSESLDLGLTWSAPAPVPGMGRRGHPDGIEEGFCDTVPEHHAPTGSILAIAQNVYYKDNRLTRPSERRWPVYIVRSRDGRWSELRKL
ncbi:MAG: exo-alpha-sialidase, partial [Acidobacteria bacterium]|nr:exo-alpha-sialidase [Acidobacteriota bacterium]